MNAGGICQLRQSSASWRLRPRHRAWPVGPSSSVAEAARGPLPAVRGAVFRLSFPAAKYGCGTDKCPVTAHRPVLGDIDLPRSTSVTKDRATRHLLQSQTGLLQASGELRSLSSNLDSARWPSTQIARA